MLKSHLRQVAIKCIKEKEEIFEDFVYKKKEKKRKASELSLPDSDFDLYFSQLIEASQYDENEEDEQMQLDLSSLLYQLINYS